MPNNSGASNINQGSNNRRMPRPRNTNDSSIESAGISQGLTPNDASTSQPNFSGAEPRNEGQFEPTGTPYRGRVNTGSNSHQATSGPSIPQFSSPRFAPSNVSVNVGRSQSSIRLNVRRPGSSNRPRGQGERSSSPIIYNSSRLEARQTSYPAPRMPSPSSGNTHYALNSLTFSTPSQNLPTANPSEQSPTVVGAGNNAESNPQTQRRRISLGHQHGPQSQLYAVQNSGPSTTEQPFSWNQVESVADMRSIPVSSAEHVMRELAIGLRSLIQDGTSRSLVNGDTNNGLGVPFSTHVAPSSGWRPLAVRPQIFYHASVYLIHGYSFGVPFNTHAGPSPSPGIPGFRPRVSYPEPFLLPPSVLSASLSHTGSSSGVNSQSHPQQYQETTVLFLRELIDHYRQLLAAVNAHRERLIFEAMTIVFADRYLVMPADVDNMPYEALLEVEESIGDVNTGLSEETISQFLEQRGYILTPKDSSDDMDLCCICREDYVMGDHMMIVDCGHVFHAHCIKEWLKLKNLCPICRKTALTT